MKPRKRRVNALACMLWLFLRARERQSLKYDAVRAEIGISRRTYHRYLATLRHAGVRIEFDRASSAFHYFCADSDLAPIIGTL